mgnify:CR=1 FL=1
MTINMRSLKIHVQKSNTLHWDQNSKQNLVYSRKPLLGHPQPTAISTPFPYISFFYALHDAHSPEAVGPLF